jgi:UDP-glucose 4-epimerase
MKALVTGGAGFLGHHIVKELLKQGTETIIYDQSEFMGHSLNLKKRELPSLLTYIQGNILDIDLLESAMKGCDIVFHTAAVADIDEARHIPIKTMEVNVLGTVKCLDAARRSGVRRFIYASSAYTAGNRGSFYRVSKQTGESLCKTFSEDYGLKYTILRYGSLYGSESNQWNFIYSMCKALLTTGEYTYVSSPDSEREYIHIHDASRETVRIARSEEFINKAVLITGHQRIKIRELFFMIQEILGKDLKIHYTPREQQHHYVMTPYSFEADVPMRVNLSTYVDISEGILDCLRAVQDELDRHKQSEPIDN